ncbi:MAG: beta-ketoacyl-ACP synthase II [Armatimonadetes bacterium]|nr:beta-ketoacyl-ACP synthase II [Armatimonadota bacterium]MBS1700142.1 beta-ketoacyl-ACP synthase II [Armatimonadota bacterium]MBS1726717.1 beta-ketoacyl-ACP synthase II [Armatimonadota bacterium]
MSFPPEPSGRVVVTGVGAVTPLGTGVDVFWPRVVAGESGVRRITNIDPTPYATQVAAEVPDFNIEDWYCENFEKKDARRMDKFIHFAIASARQALDDSGIELTEDLRNEFGVLIGTGVGGLGIMYDNTAFIHGGKPDRVSPFFVPYMIADMASGMVSIINDLRGPNHTVVSACSTGANAIGDSYEMIKRGDAVAMLAGGTEAAINDIGIAGFCACRAMTNRNDEPLRASRPFDVDRDGFVMGEGSAVLVLEDRDHAIARGAKIYAEIIGYGMSADAYHITSPHPEGRGAAKSMTMALRKAKLQPEQIDYINAHGTSTPVGDPMEVSAVKKVFGDHAYKLAMSSTKSMHGHTLGAAGAIESLICILAMRDGVMPPTINLENPDPACDLNHVPNVAQKRELTYVLNNSFGFGGHNVSLIMTKG